MRLDSSTAGFRPVRRDQLHQEYEHDSYKRQQKPPEPSACTECGAIFHAGRWQWGERNPESENTLCPACQRIRDHFPAGFLHVGGVFFAAHRHEILALIRHHEEKLRTEHPLARIMNITEEDNGADDGTEGVLVTTTDIHLARDLGEALHHAYHGDLDFHYNEAEKLLRIRWQR